MRNPWWNVMRLDRVCPATVNDRNIAFHTMRNRAGTIFNFSTRHGDRYGRDKARKVETMFVHTDAMFRSKNRAHKHGSLNFDIIVEHVPYGTVSLPGHHPIWDAPMEDFDHTLVFHTVQRDLVIGPGGTCATREIKPPPAHLRDFIAIYTTFGCIAHDEISQMMLKLSVPPFGTILRGGA